jgi:D-lactate dehydrogenase
MKEHSMELAIYSSTPYERRYLDESNKAAGHHLKYIDMSLSMDTVSLAEGYGAVCVFVNDKADAEVLKALHIGGTRLLALRCTGFNNVDLQAASELGVKVARVVTYSPNSVAEHAGALLLAINRKVHRAYNRTRESNFSLDGLIGFDLCGKTVAVVGTGKIGCVFAKIMLGFGCNVIGYDPHPSAQFQALGVRYATPGEIGEKADVISLHCPLTPATHHIINAETLKRAKRGALLINTSRGALIDTQAVIEALKSGQLGGLGIDVYEQEASLFFRNLSNEIIADDVIQRLISFPNVIVTGHQAYLTHEALTTICDTTLKSITDFEQGKPLENEVTA